MRPSLRQHGRTVATGRRLTPSGRSLASLGWRGSPESDSKRWWPPPSMTCRPTWLVPSTMWPWWSRAAAAGTPLYGLYQGVPLTRRGNGYAGALPDRITIYQDQICDSCTTEEQVVAQVRKTVLHEFGHHFGISDARLHELGWA